MKKLISLLCVTVMLTSVLAGCTPTKSQVDGSSAKELSSAQADAGGKAELMNREGLPIVNEPYTLNFMAIQHDVVFKDLNELGIVKKWTEETGITFDIDVVTQQDKTERVNLAIATNNLPDVFYGGIATDLVRNGSEGTYIALDKYIDDLCPNITGLFTERPEIKKTVTAPDGHIYGFPKFYETGQHSSYGQYIHMDWLKETGLAMPTTTDEFLTVLRAMKGKDLNGNGAADEFPLGLCQKDGKNNYGNIFMWFGLPSYNIVYVGDNGTVESGFTHPAYKEGLSYLRSIYEEKLCDPEAYTQDVQAFRSKVKEYKYGSFFMFAPYNAFGNEMNKEDYRYELVPALLGPQKTTGWVWGPTMPEINSMVITKDCKNPEIAVRFADYCASTEMSLQLGEGLLGQNLLSNGDGTYHMADPMLEHEIFGGMSFHMLTQDRLNLVKPGFFATQRVPRSKMYEPVVDMDAIFPVIIPTPEESTRIAVLQTEIQNFVDQKQAEWVCNGGLDKEWDSYVKQLDDMKLKELISIYQVQYDRYIGK